MTKLKKVLIVTFDFPPQGGTGVLRVTKFVKYLPQFGWQPIVVCSDTLWNSDESLARDIAPSTPVYRVHRPWPTHRGMHLSSSPGSADSLTLTAWFRKQAVCFAHRVMIPDPNIVWIPGAIRKCLRVLDEHSCEVVLTTSPPNSVHLIGAWLKHHKQLPWVADFRDTWTVENKVLQGVGKLHLKMQQFAEKQVLDRCDRAIMTSESLAQATQTLFGAPIASKCRTITNGFDSEDFDSTSSVLNKYKFVITFAGTMLGHRVDNAFPEGLSRAIAQSDVFRNTAQARFIGQFAPEYRRRLEKLAPFVEILPFIPHRDAINIMRRSHLLLLILPPTVLSGMTLTNKFFEYLAARRPILAVAPPGIITTLVMEEKLGAVAAPDNPDAIADALLMMFDSVRSQPDDCHPSRELLARFERSELTRQLAMLLNEIPPASVHSEPV